MGNVIKYHLATKPPLVLILWLYIYGIVNTFVFIELFIAFWLVYWPWVDFFRLKSLGILRSNSFTKSYFRIWKLRFQYYSDVMFKNANAHE